MKKNQSVIRLNIIFIVIALLVLPPTDFFVFSQGDPAHAATEDELSPEEYIEYLEFREVDIKDVLRQLSKQYNLNIVFSESVKGLITVQLHGVTVEEALDSIVTINGFMYTKKGPVIKVTTAAEAEKEGKQTKVFRLNNADAGKLKDTLAKTLSSEGKIEADTRSNALIITDNIAVISKLEAMIPKLDDMTMQVLIEARFIEATLGTTEKLGVDWTTAISASGSRRPTTFPFRKWGSDKDMYPSPEATEDLTINFDDGTFETTTSSEFPNIVKGTRLTNMQGLGTLFEVANQYGSFPTVGADQFTFGALSFSQLQAVLGFLRSKSDTKLLSSPRIVTTDNKQAMIQVGQTVRILSEETYDEQTKQRSYSYEKQQVGVILTVTPQVSPDRRIKLQLKPEVSSVVGYNPGTSIPIVGTRTAETEVVIKDGQTIVIGGLVKTEKTESINKLPFLGDLPLIGKLFSHRQEDPNSKTDLLIFVTARIIKENEGPVLAMESGMKVSPLRPLKLELRDTVLGNEKKRKN